MSLQSPLFLVALLLLPLLVVWYVRQLRRRRRSVRHSSVALIRAAAPKGPTWRRHLPFALVLAALAALGAAAARPTLAAEVPISESTVVIALDVSGSMCANDVVPNRLSAAQAAVRDFVRAQDPGTGVGLVVFSGFAQLAVAPTTDREPLLRAVDGLTTGRGTAIGAAVLKAVDAISEIDPRVTPTDPGAPPPPRRAQGSYAPEIVVLLTDGANTRGITPTDAAKAAADRGVRVYPIGFGTPNPTSLVCTAAQLGGQTGERFGNGGLVGGGGSYLRADEATLREVATTTGGAYFSATDAGRLNEVLRDLPRVVATQHREIEISAGLAGLAIVLLLASAWAAARYTAFPS